MRNKLNTRHTEFEVHSFIYNRLRNEFEPEFKIRAEIKYKACRPDISIFHNSGDLIAVVEVKRSEGSRAEAKKVKYEKLLGVPCIYAKGFKSAPHVVRQITLYTSRYLEA